MARGRDDDSGLDRVIGSLDEAPVGLHDLDAAAPRLPHGLPEALIDLYARCDGGRLFLETLEIAPSADVVSPTPGRWQFATLAGEPVTVDKRGRVFGIDDTLDDEVCEGTRLDRWLAGFVDATALLYDHDGEFAEDIFDEEGDLLPEVRERQLRAQLKRDGGSPAVRWRLAGLIAAKGETARARDELEQVVAAEPAFAWAWLDLARLSEQLGDLSNAMDEIQAAAEAAAGAKHPQAGYFFAQLARVAVRAGDEPTRTMAASTAARLAPELKRAQLDGALASIADADLDSARGLLDLLKAVWPKDLEVLDLATRIERAAN